MLVLCLLVLFGAFAPLRADAAGGITVTGSDAVCDNFADAVAGIAADDAVIDLGGCQRCFDRR